MFTPSFLHVLPNIVLAPCPLGPGWGAVTAAITLVKGDRLAVIDTGVRAYMPQAIEPGLAALGCGVADIGLIVNTHGHWDHVQGNALLHAASAAPIYCPTDDASLLETPPHHTLTDGDALDLGGLRLLVIHTPGHSPGMSCLYEPTLRLLIVSDAIQGYGAANAGVPLYFHSGDQYRASLQRLRGLAIDTLVLGHEFAWAGPERFVHEGADVYRFLDASIEAARHTGLAARAAVDECGPTDWQCIQQTFARNLAGAPGFGVDISKPLSSLAQGTLRSDLRDLGVTF